jgi:hypothetical protein
MEVARHLSAGDIRAKEIQPVKRVAEYSKQQTALAVSYTDCEPLPGNSSTKVLD